MKSVQIKDLSGNLITGGIMGKEAFLDYISGVAGADMLPDAEILWDQATRFSLSDYLKTVKVNVREIY